VTTEMKSMHKPKKPTSTLSAVHANNCGRVIISEFTDSIPVYVGFEGRADVCALTTLNDQLLRFVSQAKQGDLNSVHVVGPRGMAFLYLSKTSVPAVH
jgi:hypothetical protein